MQDKHKLYVLINRKVLWTNWKVMLVEYVLQNEKLDGQHVPWCTYVVLDDVIKSIVVNISNYLKIFNNLTMLQIIETETTERERNTF